LRDLFRWAKVVKEDGGIRSTFPERVSVASKRMETATLHASTRRASGAEKYPPIRKAIDVLITVEACDSTSYLVPLLSADGEEAERIWRQVPVALLCDGCRIRRYASQLNTRRCPRCKGELRSYPEMIADDEGDAIKRLNKGGIFCE
jgi:hypothetical protein